MTVVIGMFSTDGDFVMGADGEESGETLKTSVTKLPVYRRKNEDALVIGGAGPACHVDAITELLFEKFSETSDPATFPTVIRTVLENYYKEHVLCWPSVMERADNDFALLIGMSLREKSKKSTHQLWVTELNTLRPVHRHAAVGLGQTYANALMEQHKGCYSVTLAAMVAIYVLQRIKRDVANCGKETQIWRFAEKGGAQFTAQSSIQKAEELFQEFDVQC
jgi:hypothetical protein